MMKRTLIALFAVGMMAFASSAYANKSKLGEYFLGFSYFAGDAASADIDILDVELANPLSESTDFRVGLAWMNVDHKVFGDDTAWWLELDYIYHYDDLVHAGGMFRPYASIGGGYSNDSRNLILGQNDLNWKIGLGSEFLFSSSFSASLGLNFYGLLSDFGNNDSEWELSFLYWFGDIHGAGFEFRHSNDADVNYFGLRYLYSWQ